LLSVWQHSHKIIRHPEQTGRQSIGGTRELTYALNEILGGKIVPFAAGGSPFA
jgi:hypothetical protein